MLKFAAFLMMCLLASESNAFLVTTYSSDKLNYNLPTRILVAGAGDDLGTQFQQVARGKALKYSQQYPNEQIVLIAADEPDIDDKIALQNWGFNFQRENKSTFNGDTFLDEAKKFKQIASIDIFSHSSAQYGIHLDGKAHRLTLNTKNVERLKGHFTKDAYAFLHGCNGGFNLAPFLSNAWEIPVAGAMTSTNFQKLHSDGNFYLTEEGFFPNTDWAQTNDKTFNESVKCNAGMCLRLKPDNNPYTGFWGEYGDGGLSFYKFFCIKNSPDACKRVMAKSLLGFVGNTNLKAGATLVEYKKLLFDFLCPVSAKRDLRRECEQNLENALVTGDLTYNPFSRKQIECNFQSCSVEIKCQKVLLTGIYRPGTCQLINNFEGKSTTLVREYKAYLEGFNNLNN
ncbi:MAG: hypothetical protein PHY93_00905 [Bacteriovorax sp.]|nr:hypothetical protein [Bacteriovorax sp.]